MHTADPPYVRTVRLLLAMIYVAGVAALFLPFCYDISVAHFTLLEPEMVSELFRSRLDWENVSLYLAALLAPGPFYVPLVLGPLQIRSMFNARFHRWELRFIAAVALVASASAVLLQLLYTILAVQNIDEWTSSGEGWWVVACVAAGWVSLALVVGLMVLHRFRPTTAGLKWLRLSRAAFVMQAAQVGVCFGMQDDLRAGGWIFIALAVWLVGEIIVFCRYGRRYSNGTAAHTLMRYWLPREEANPRPEFPACTNCGYDLRGTIPAGGRVCPECGTAIAAT